MPSFRLVDKTRTFFGNQAQLLAGGNLKFYNAGTTTPQNVYGDKALTVNNGSSVDLDSSGRPSVDVWADTTDAYFIEVYDADGVKQGELDHMEVPGGAGQTIPVPDDGEFLTGDGTNFIAVSLDGKLLPDMSGNANKILGTDGSLASWVARPADGATPSVTLPAGGVTVGAWSLQAGKLLIQGGSGSAGSSGAHTTSGAVSFATAYASTPKILLQPTGGGITSDGYFAVPQVTSASGSGFTAGINVNEDGSESGKNINSSVPFDYIAIGTVP